jgi:hypothetical protein
MTNQRSYRDGLAVLGRLESAGRFAPHVRCGSAAFYDGVDAPPTASMCQSGGVEHHLREASVSEVIIIRLDIAKYVFHVHRADERRASGEQTRRPEGFVARSDAGSQTAHAGDRRARQQDGADHLGTTCKAGKLQSSGRSQGVSLPDLRSSQV